MDSAGNSTIDLLVVGAGPVGLALALETGRAGLRVLVIEQNERGGQQPRAKTTNIRSMTHMRRWGLAEAVRAASPLPPDYPTDVVFATRLFGHPLARFENAFFGYRERSPEFPEPAQWIPQYTIEAVLRAALAALPNVEVRFNTALTDLAQDAAGVTATVTDAATGHPHALRAAYAVGSDGGRSATRRLLGLKLEGDHAYMANWLAIFRAPGLLDLHPQRRAVSYWLVNADAPCTMGPMDRGDTWYFSTQLRGADPYTPAEGAAKIRQALGRDVPFEVLDSDVWYAHKLIADRYGVGRVYLAGDACHLHPPFGGYGMNQGIGDAVDLGWKLAGVLAGWAPPALLETYETERKPVHRMFVEEATANYAFVTHHMVMAQLEADTPDGAAARAELGARILAGKRREFRPLGAILGYTYAGSPAVIPDGTAAPPLDPLDYIPSASPGALAPHLWLDDGASLYDRFGPGFTLLELAPEAAPDADRIMAAAAARAMPVHRARITEPAARALYGAALALIRPDQHVAWRGDRLDREPAALLAQVTGHRTAAPQPESLVA